MAIFEVIKEPLPFDAEQFDRMAARARRALEAAEMGQYTEAVVLSTEKEGLHCAVIMDATAPEKAAEGALLDALRAGSDTRVHRVLSLWQDGSVDIPSYAFRKMLCELDRENLNAGIFVMTESGYSVIRLGNTVRL